jgi:mRNA interferase RelE/StbE
MNEYRITFSRSARKDLEKLSPQVVNRIFKKIELLHQNPRPKGIRKIAGNNDLWRIRIGDYRVIYTINDAGRTVDIAIIRHRSQAYQ